MRAILLLVLGFMLCIIAADAQLGQLPIYVVPSPSGVAPPTVYPGCGLAVSLGSIARPMTASLGNISGGQTMSLGQGC